MQTLRAKLREAAQGQMSADPAHDLAHLDRVWGVTQAIAQREGGDLRVLLGAAYLHDLVNLPKDAPDRHKASALSADAAVPILRLLGYEADEIDGTCHAITAHSFSGGVEPQSRESMILRDADRLDALGAIGIARTFVVAGALGRPLYDPDDPFAKSRPLDDQRWSLDHWQVKLLHLSHGMLTETGREIAQNRSRVMRDFLWQLARELAREPAREPDCEIETALPEVWAP
ncbi:MAG: HD domain-containing protein [Rhodobacteraceae bacterium]|nr:HD domain-containing protein [Paracoccaceae bacterium]